MNPVEASRAVPGERATESTSLWWPSNVPTQAAVSRSQTRTVRSLEPETARRPSGVIWTEYTAPE
jgi:hypothetical protein